MGKEGKNFEENTGQKAIEKNTETKDADLIQRHIDNEVEKHRDDLDPSPLRMVKRADIIPAVEKLFLEFISGNADFVAEAPQVLALKEIVKKIKDEGIRDSNQQFIASFDHKINPNLETDRGFKAQDNT